MKNNILFKRFFIVLRSSLYVIFFNFQSDLFAQCNVSINVTSVHFSVSYGVSVIHKAIAFRNSGTWFTTSTSGIPISIFFSGSDFVIVLTTKTTYFADLRTL
jgi:hypothetical protein